MDDHRERLRAEWTHDEPSPALRRQLVLRASLCRRLARGHDKLEALMRGERAPQTVAERAFFLVWRAHEAASDDEFLHAWEALCIALQVS